jgi:hypothetical protein
MAEDRTPQTPRPRKAPNQGGKAAPGAGGTPRKAPEPRAAEPRAVEPRAADRRTTEPSATEASPAKKVAPSKAAPKKATRPAPPPVLFQPPTPAQDPPPAAGRHRTREPRPAEPTRTAPSQAAPVGPPTTPATAPAAAPAAAAPERKAKKAATARVPKKAAAPTAEINNQAPPAKPARATRKAAVPRARATEPAAGETPVGAEKTIKSETPTKTAQEPTTTAQKPTTTAQVLTTTAQDPELATTAQDKEPTTTAEKPTTDAVPLTAREPRLTAPDRPGWWARVPTNPGYAPELLALAAVESIGPRARAWVTDVQATYPAATADGIARLAVRRFTRVAATGGALASATGLVGPIAEVATLAWAQAGLVLHLAAAYGASPTDRERAVDLLVLTRVHPTPELARAALESAGEDADDAPHSLQRATEAAWRLAAPLASQTAGWLALRMFARLVPTLRMLVAGAGDGAAAERLAHRAIAHYRAMAGRPITIS